ncbi:MAG TPA: DMT family transporter [Candidatus Dormibacteraeota bacterium]|nr:DMT family transporter [Verrucomicrobiae bacterium]HXJ76291.1 DMT family transporter [Candidatus Dormibacteraeota bacterium]
MARWILYAVLTVFFWGIWGFIPRQLNALAAARHAEVISAEQQQVISTLGLLPILLVLAGRRGRLGGSRIKRGCAMALGAGLVGSIGNLLFYHLQNVGQNAATVVPFTSLYPLVTVVLAMVLLKEKLNPIQIAGIGLALVSMYFFNVGREEPFSSRWLGFALLPIGCWGVAGLLQKLCTNDVSAELSTLCFLGGLLPLSLLLVLVRPMNWQMPVNEWVWAVALGLFLGLGNLTFLAAFAAGGKAAVVTPLAGLYSLVTVPLAVGWVGDKVSPREWLAIALALLAVTALALESAPAPSVPEAK